MNKDTTYKEKFAILNEWLDPIIDEVKKDLKNDHLRQDMAFVKQYLPAKNLNKVGTQDLVAAYTAAIAENEKGEEIAEFISNRWLLKNTDLYHYFEKELTKINPDFSEITEIDLPTSKKIVEGSISQFGPSRTYFFTILNSVMFPKEVLDDLNKKTKSVKIEKDEHEKVLGEKKSIDDLKTHYEREIARLTDKLEKKLLGLQKKYEVDTEALKKQVVSLQRKISGK